MHVCKLFSLHYLSPKNFLVIPFPTMSLNLPFTLIKVNYTFHIWRTLSILQIWSSGLVYICNDLPTSSEDTKLIHPTQLCHTCHLVHKVYMILLSLKWHYKGQNGNPLQCSCLRIPGTVEPDGLPSMGLHRVRHDWSDLAVAAAAVCLCVPYFSCSFGLYYNYLLYWAMSSLRATSRSVVLPPFSKCLVGYLCAQQWCVFGCVCSVVSYPFQPSSSVHGIFQARILEWVAISFSRGSSWPRDQISCIPCIGRQILCHCATWEVLNRGSAMKEKQSFAQYITSVFCGKKVIVLELQGTVSWRSWELTLERSNERHSR